jgi:inner membrane protein
VDAISLGAGPLAYLNWHRHLTHALPVLPLLALLPVVIVRLAARKPLPWLRAWCVSAVGLASHLALDLANIYGIRLLLPFDGRWFRLDWLSVVDLWIWAICLAGICGPLLAGLVNSEIGARRPAPARGFAILALCALSLYTGARGVLHERAVAVFDSRLYDGAAPLRVAALPSPANPLRWRGLVETASFYALPEWTPLVPFDPSAGRRYYKPDESPARQAAAATPVFRDFLRFSQFPLWRASPVWDPAPGTRVESMDLRFGAPPSPAFVATALVDAAGRPVRSWFSFGSAGPR